MKFDILISHNSEDQSIAEKLKDLIETVFPNTEVYVSGRNLEGGQTWINEIKKRLGTSKVIISLITQNSLRNLWVYFESGAGFVEDRTIPLVFFDVSINQLSAPLNVIQARDFSINGFEQLFGDLQRKLDTPLKERGLKTAMGYAKELLTELPLEINKSKLNYLHNFFHGAGLKTVKKGVWIYESRCLVFDYDVNGHRIAVDVYFDRPVIEIEIFGRNDDSSRYLFEVMLNSAIFSNKLFGSQQFNNQRLIYASYGVTIEREQLQEHLIEVTKKIEKYKTSVE